MTKTVKGTHDPVNHPDHYTAGGIECIDAIKAALTCQKDPMQAWLTGQVLKYLWRWPLKNGLEDLRKADFYLHRLMEDVQSKTPTMDNLSIDCEADKRAAEFEKEFRRLAEQSAQAQDYTIKNRTP